MLKLVDHTVQLGPVPAAAGRMLLEGALDAGGAEGCELGAIDCSSPFDTRA